MAVFEHRQGLSVPVLIILCCLFQVICYHLLTNGIYICLKLPCWTDLLAGDGWMDGLQFYVFSSISVISGRCEGGNEMMCAMEAR